MADNHGKNGMFGLVLGGVVVAAAAFFILTGGELGGTGTVTVNGAFDWTAGTMRGPGKTIAKGATSLAAAAIALTFLAFASPFDSALAFAALAGFLAAGVLVAFFVVMVQLLVGGWFQRKSPEHESHISHALRSKASQVPDNLSLFGGARMPHLLKHRCRMPGCPRTTRERYCEEHQPVAQRAVG